ncbi:hypothetical protein BH09SUM1_BH09SUM1_11150 [soil metagenome]
MILRKRVLFITMALALGASTLGHAQLVAPSTDEHEAMKATAARVGEIMEKERAVNAALEADLEKFGKLDADSRKKILGEEFLAGQEKLPMLKLDAGAGFTVSQLKQYTPTIADGGVSLIHGKATKPVVLKVGDTLELKHDDGSSLFVVLESAKGDEAVFRLGEMRFNMTADGSVKASTPKELREKEFEILGKFNQGSDPILLRTGDMAFTDALRRLEQKSGATILVSGAIDAKAIKIEREPRPLEFLLTQICMTGRNWDGRAIVWEKRGDHYFVRPFPIYEHPSDNLERPFELVSLNEDGSVELKIGAEKKKVEVFDHIRIPLQGKSYGEAIVDQINAPFREAILNCGGAKLVLCNVPEDNAAKMAIVGETGAPAAGLLRRLGVAAGVEIVPDPSIKDAPVWAPDTATRVGDILNQISAQNGWTMRWFSAKKLVVGTDAALGSADWETARLTAAP